MLTDTDPETGDYVIPRIIYSDAYSSETVAYADLVLPDTTYLERHDCISLLDRPISRAGRRRRRDPLAGDRARPRRAAASSRCWWTSAHRLGLPGFVNADGSAKYADYADYIVNHQRRPGVGPLAGWRDGAAGPAGRARRAERRAARRATSRNGGFWQGHVPEEAAFFKPWNRAYQDWAVADGPLRRAPALPLHPLASRSAASSSPPRARARASRPTTCAPASTRRWTRCPSGTPPFGDACDEAAYPLHAITQRPDGDVPRLGLAERLAAADPRAEPALRPRRGLGGAGVRVRRLGPRDLAARVDHRAGRADGGAERARPSGPGTPSASARAPGRSTPRRPRRPRGSSSTT